MSLDTAAGLDRMMGDRAMYLRVLARFRSDYADTVARLRAALVVGDMALAYRIAHTLKGAAAMIEARGLRMLALDVEQQLRTGAAADMGMLARLETELARVIAQVDLLVTAPAPTDAVFNGTGVALPEHDVAQLYGLLDLGDSAAQDFIAEKRAGLQHRLGGVRMAELESAVAAFDYERALCLLNATRDIS